MRGQRVPSARAAQPAQPTAAQPAAAQQPAAHSPPLSIAGIGPNARRPSNQPAPPRGSPGARGVTGPIKAESRSPSVGSLASRSPGNAGGRTTGVNGATPIGVFATRAPSGTSNVSTTSSASQSPAASSFGSRKAPILAVLQASPLVHAGRPLEMLDHKSERDAIISSVQRTGRRVHVVCDFCTTRRMGALLTDGCRMLHYSGHGFSDVDQTGRERTRLAFENESGGTHAMDVEKLTALVRTSADRSHGRPPLDLAIVSACHSVRGGQAFVDAGVPHVVAVRRDGELQDKAACVFAGALYHALFRGRSVAAAFEIGKQAVANQPGILRGGQESEKFCLLPVGGSHDKPLCSGLLEGDAVIEMPLKAYNNLPAFFPLQFVGRQSEWHELVSAAVAPEKRLLTLVGEPGMGKTALTVAAAHYLLERSMFGGGVFFARVQGLLTAPDVIGSIKAALSDASVTIGADADRTESLEQSLSMTLRRLGACLLVLDHWELTHSNNELLQVLLQSAPELRLLLSCKQPLSFPGVGQRQVLLGPLDLEEAGCLFRLLAPRSITRAEVRLLERGVASLRLRSMPVRHFRLTFASFAPCATQDTSPALKAYICNLVGCDEKGRLREEMQKLIDQFRDKIPGIDQFSLLPPPSVPLSDTMQIQPPLRVQWTLPSFIAATALFRELRSFPSLLQFDVPPPTASGRACLFCYLSLPKMVASHSLLSMLRGNPKAIALAASLLLSHTRAPRSLDEVYELVEDPAGSKASEISDSCLAILEQLEAILRAEVSSPPRTRRPHHTMETPDRAKGGPSKDWSRGGDSPSREVEAAAQEGETLPASLLLRPEEYKKMFGLSCLRSLGTGLFGTVYETELAGTKVALKQFHENSCSATAFKREALLLADIRHPNIVQLIKVGLRPELCIVTELLMCSLHAMIHLGAGGALRERLLKPEAVTQICMHIARGMNYLHSLEKIVIHRNLNSKNLLLDDGGKVKISDFGWSCCKADLGKTFHISWEWVAPEVLGGGSFSEKADVYSFAMVAWEVCALRVQFQETVWDTLAHHLSSVVLTTHRREPMHPIIQVLTRSRPFEGMNPMQLGFAVGSQGYRPPIPHDAQQGMADLIMSCWHDNPQQRPTFARVLGTLQALDVLSA